MKRQPRAASKCLGLRAWVRIAILLPPRLFADYVFLMQEMLLVAGTMQACSVGMMGSRLLDVDVLSADGAAVRSFGNMPAPATAALTDAAYDVVIIPVQFALETILDAEEVHIADWLHMRYEAGVLVVGMNAAPLFAKARLLDGCRATGLASERAWLARHFPNVHYTPDRPLTVDGHIITVSGTNPTVDVCVYVIGHYRGVGIPQRILRTAPTQSLPSYGHMVVWMAQFKRYGDTVMLATQEIVERELAAPPTLAELAAQVAMSEWGPTCRLAVATGNNLRRYVAALRSEPATFPLRAGWQPLDHIADECDYGSVSALSRVLSAGHGCSPLQCRTQHRIR